MSRVKMLKQATLHTPYPRRYLTHPPYACQNRRLTHWTCPLPGFALGWEKNPQRTEGKSRSWPAAGWAGEMSVRLRFFLPCGLVGRPV